ncbi:MAG: M48 family metallopeptidase [Chlorobium sp.]|jgi:predicted metal-dependent hydrolase|uniref:M48 family metallopeptidase n=1 Tax=Chlorobium sp. TaxID=1095 RepID=UPI001DAE23CC|nr:SprT family zinc-dependent metalloprotease [Chlorobium sp.]MBN1279493.1 M48 family metallopeptidase [Chlorobiaceae bacterium]MCF8216486.1 M48 family metallopeptidase [Chlorobium sp.]MCF8271391.1 M48 family metallopeptidase [Chlorobium sp.]MCF8287763.1 M48 family metallopeptidase [Chlorobium sp.]MCF8291302.1 M48 family metallopeptidase [Chlorobium sp.]
MNDESSKMEIDGIICSVRVHARSKYVRLKMVLHEGLVIVVPPGYDRASVTKVLLRHREWIRAAAERLASVHQELRRISPDLLPESIEILFSGEHIRICYERRFDDGVAYSIDPGGTLHISGKTGSTGLCRAVLQMWLKHKAADLLFPELTRLAMLHGFSFKRSGIRLQKSRWGSCSSSGTITLNAKLIFLPPHLVRSVLLHELCHTVHMNHSPSFKRLLETYDPDRHLHEMQMKTASRHIPVWAVLRV